MASLICNRTTPKFAMHLVNDMAASWHLLHMCKDGMNKSHARAAWAVFNLRSGPTNGEICWRVDGQNWSSNAVRWSRGSANRISRVFWRKKIFTIPDPSTQSTASSTGSTFITRHLLHTLVLLRLPLKLLTLWRVSCQAEFRKQLWPDNLIVARVYFVLPLVVSISYSLQNNGTTETLVRKGKGKFETIT